jgi:ketosteroid isomerase-like protein
MSRENVELFRRGIETYNRRDIEAMLELWHPEAVWYRDGLGVWGRAYQSHAEALDAAGLYE